MTLQTVGYVLLAVAAIAFLVYRQTTWQPVQLGRMLRLPLILAAIGVYSLLSEKHIAIHPIDVAALAAELVVSLALGAVMGMLSVFRPITDAALERWRARRRPSDASPRAEVRTGWLGAALWIVLIAIRVGMDVGAEALGAHAAASTGVILIVVAANRVARALVVAQRLDRHPPLAA